MTQWEVDQVLHFDFSVGGDLLVNGLAHFGFHVRGRYYAIDHPRHVLGLVGVDGALEWTAAKAPVVAGVANIPVTLDYPIYVDAFPDETLVVSNFGDARVYRIDPRAMAARLLINGPSSGLRDAGNCVVDSEGSIWINEVTGCRIWQFDEHGRVVRVLGDGTPGFQRDPVDFTHVRFSWIYDLRRAPDGRLLVLDSGNFALRMIDPVAQRVTVVAGTGKPGYDGDGGIATEATFGSDPTARFDGPISLAVDEVGNLYVGDRHNHVLRRIDAATGLIDTIAGRPDFDGQRRNDPDERDPTKVNLPMISSLDFAGGRIFLPTDLEGDRGDLVVLRPTPADVPVRVE